MVPEEIVISQQAIDVIDQHPQGASDEVADAYAESEQKKPDGQESVPIWKMTRRLNKKINRTRSSGKDLVHHDLVHHKTKFMDDSEIKGRNNNSMTKEPRDA